MVALHAIPFHWVLGRAGADAVAGRLPALQGPLERNMIEESSEPDPHLAGLLQSAGLHLDQQWRASHVVSARVALVGTADLAALAASIYDFTQQAEATGGLVVDCCGTPVEITEVPGISTKTVVVADPKGARQIPLNQEAITSALVNALSPDSPRLAS